MRAAERLLALINGTGATEDAHPVLVSGPIHWRASVTERTVPRVHQLKAVREDWPCCV